MTTSSDGPFAMELPRMTAGRVIDINDRHGNIIAQTTNRYPRQVAEANARLLAASWEMREFITQSITEPGSVAHTRGSLKYALQRLDAITEQARALLARIDGTEGGTR